MELKRGDRVRVQREKERERDRVKSIAIAVSVRYQISSELRGFAGTATKCTNNKQDALAELLYYS